MLPKLCFFYYHTEETLLINISDKSHNVSKNVNIFHLFTYDTPPEICLYIIVMFRQSQHLIGETSWSWFDREKVYSDLKDTKLTKKAFVA